MIAMRPRWLTRSRQDSGTRAVRPARRVWKGHVDSSFKWVGVVDAITLSENGSLAPSDAAVFIASYKGETKATETAGWEASAWGSCWNGELLVTMERYGCHTFLRQQANENRSLPSASACCQLRSSCLVEDRGQLVSYLSSWRIRFAALSTS